MTYDTLNAVRQFLIAGEQTIPEQPDISDPDLNQLRVDLLWEELKELESALRNQDMVEVLDALVDMLYVLDGAFLAFGLHEARDPGFAEVHRSNMSKFVNGKPVARRPDGKVLKPDTYSPPDLTAVMDAVYNI